MDFLEKLKFDSQGLIPAVTVDAVSGKPLMLAYMNCESLAQTIETGFVHYYSRSRKCLWKKGETSGNIQRLVSIDADCDFDSLLVRVEQSGPACHTGEQSCFFNRLIEKESVADGGVIYENIRTIKNRAENPVNGSYTNYLLAKGVDKICKKVGEEAAETIIAAKNEDNDELKNEISDLIFHTLVLMHARGLGIEEVFEVLEKRSQEERKRNY